MVKIAGTVILYKPDTGVLANIYSYLDQIDKLYIIDNSDAASEIIKKEFQYNKNVEYLANNRNLGIASALNLALVQAEKDGFEYLLTMDQDSYFEDKIIEKMVTRVLEDEKIGIVSARHHYPVGKKAAEKSPSIIDKLVAMTSGNIVKVKLLRSIGGYKDDLFVDYVDHEICLRLNSLGYMVKILDDYKVIHSLGNVNVKRLLWKKIYPTNHSYIRHYYRTRNRFFVYKTYGKIFSDYRKIELLNFIKDILKIILLEDQKWKKLKFIFWGLSDFKNNVFGECGRV
jgi:rhamnosyltransferase